MPVLLARARALSSPVEVEPKDKTVYQSITAAAAAAFLCQQQEVPCAKHTHTILSRVLFFFSGYIKLVKVDYSWHDKQDAGAR
jgi:hypothetical protein